MPALTLTKSDICVDLCTGVLVDIDDTKSDTDFVFVGCCEKALEGNFA